MNTLPALYQLTGQYLDAQRMLAELDPDDPAIADTLEGIVGTIEEKARAVAVVARNFEALAESIGNAEKDMAARRKSLDAKAARLREYLRTNMEATGISAIEAAPDHPWFSIKLRKNPPSVDVWDEQQIPRDFYVTPEPPPPRLDKAKLGSALKAGQDIPGAKLVQNMRVEIK